MSDPRDALFSDLHREWLKPLGFRKQARKSEKDIGDGNVIVISLEKYPAGPGGPFRFSIELKATWSVDRRKPITYQRSLPSYSTKEQFWIFDETRDMAQVIESAKEQFRSEGLPAIQDMQSLEGMVRLFERTPAHVGLFWYWSDYAYLLDLLGRRNEARAVLHRAIEELKTREDVQARARQMLAAMDSGANDGLRAS